MKFTLYKGGKQSQEYWNGTKPLPDEINVMSYHIQMAEFELLSILSTLHGYISAFDLLTGSDTNTEKDKDINAVLTAFQMYIHPKMPLSRYTDSEKRMIVSPNIKSYPPIDPKS
jgi:hypothetical protein